MLVRHRFGIDEIPNPAVYMTMNKDKCRFYLTMLGECAFDFQPCRGIENCPFEEEKKDTKLDRRWNGAKKLVIHEKAIRLNRLIDIIRENNLEYVPTNKILEKMGYEPFLISSDLKEMFLMGYKKYMDWFREQNIKKNTNHYLKKNLQHGKALRLNWLIDIIKYNGLEYIPTKKQIEEMGHPNLAIHSDYTELQSIGYENYMSYARRNGLLKK